jgi:hypothetical protein
LKKIDLGQTLQFLGNAGIILGILLLVYELNQNRDMMMAQTRNELSQGITEILLDISNNEERVSIFTRGAAGEALSEYESAQYQLMTMAELRYHENVHYQYRSGLYDEDEYRAHRAQWSNFVFRQKGRVAVFCEARSGFSPEFVAEIEGLLTTYKCE